MWPFTRRNHVSPEETQAHGPEVEAQLKRSRWVDERLKAHNRANAYSDLVEGMILGRLSDG
jgi:hypothetical protein